MFHSSNSSEILSLAMHEVPRYPSIVSPIDRDSFETLCQSHYKDLLANELTVGIISNGEHDIPSDVKDVLSNIDKTPRYIVVKKDLTTSRNLYEYVLVDLFLMIQYCICIQRYISDFPEDEDEDDGYGWVDMHTD